ncbi:hypothetical protein Nepgr_025624 [Nepenthes gracilis]|uniref:Uncharacterized protein n=1 Tax=Nepenthes gracilis TaxID=150966 RepID=A0AAD3T847_NEPGR|nr:hypothetical protein Nepgr_025624 [Nepenthes gracilis]
MPSFRWSKRSLAPLLRSSVAPLRTALSLPAARRHRFTTTSKSKNKTEGRSGSLNSSSPKALKETEEVSR